MTLGGWITFLLSTGLFTLMLAWCVYKILSVPKNCAKGLKDALDSYESGKPPKKKRFSFRRSKKS